MKLLNAKELQAELNISTTLFYKLKKNGMPFHQLPGGRAFYFADDVEKWLRKAGYHQEKTWSK